MSDPVMPIPSVRPIAVEDLDTVGPDGGGSITAALFLREFVGGRRWAHLDIAGPGKVETAEHEITKGGTGFGVRTLLPLIMECARCPSPSGNGAGTSSVGLGE